MLQVCTLERKRSCQAPNGPAAIEVLTPTCDGEQVPHVGRAVPLDLVGVELGASLERPVLPDGPPALDLVPVSTLVLQAERERDVLRCAVVNRDVQGNVLAGMIQPVRVDRILGGFQVYVQAVEEWFELYPVFRSPHGVDQPIVLGVQLTGRGMEQGSVHVAPFSPSGALHV